MLPTVTELLAAAFVVAVVAQQPGHRVARARCQEPARPGRVTTATLDLELAGGSSVAAMTVPLQLRDVWEEFWAAPRLATLGTVRADGTPHLVPVKAMRDDEELLVLTRAASAKARHVVRRPWASVAEVTPTTWFTVEGKAVVSTDVDDVARGLAAYERRFGRDGWSGADCVVMVRIERVLGGR